MSFVSEGPVGLAAQQPSNGLLLVELNLLLIECFRANGPIDSLCCGVLYRPPGDEKPRRLVHPAQGSWTLASGQKAAPQTPLFAGVVSETLELEVFFYEADEAGMVPAPNDRFGGFLLRLTPQREFKWTAGERSAYLGRLSDGRHVFQLLGANSDYQITLMLFEKKPL